MFYVYEHWRTDKDECFYVGKGKGKRAYNMYKRNAFHKAIQAKIAREGYAVEVKIVESGLTEHEAFKIEIERIAFWKEAGADLANMTLGGEGASGRPSWNKKEVICLEDGNIFDSCMSAAKHYNLSIITVSDVCRHKYRSASNLHFMYTHEPINTISEIEKFHANRRKKVKENVNNWNVVKDGKDALGRNASGPMKNARPVICLDDNLKFPSASSAAKHYNVAKSAVIEMCLGKNNRVSVGGLKFKYMEPA